jgi:hypothetical protein
MLIGGACCVLAGGRALAATQVLATSDDTFVNQLNPANNNGATLTFFTGTDGHGGVMRGLVRFAMPASLQGRVTVTGAQLTLTVAALGDGSAGAAATETLQALTQAWAQGNGLGDVPSTFTVGQLCGGTITGATWNQPNCSLAGNWTTPGGTVVAAVSGQASNAGVPIGGQVVWSSAANAQLMLDVQGWIDDPSTNHGWRITSSTEGMTAQAQRFLSAEAGAAGAPSLSVTYACKPGFVPSGTDCVAAPPPSAPAAGPFAVAALALLLGVAGAAVASRRSVTRRR